MKDVGWRIREATAEAARNVVSSPGRTALMGLVAIAIFTSITAAELRFTQELLAFQQRFEEEGGYVAIATADERFPGWRCDIVGQQNYVVAVAGLSRSEPIRVPHAPGLLFQAGRFSGSLSVWDPDRNSKESTANQLALGHVAAEELGVHTGNMVLVNGSSQQVDAVIDPDDRNPEIARWLLIRANPATPIQECWVEYSPGQLQGGMEMLAASIAPATRGVEVRPWRRLDEFARDPVGELANRVQQLAWLPAALLISLLGWLVSWFRRSELGLYRALGTSNATLWYMAEVESILIVGTGLVAGFQLALVTHSFQYGLPTLHQLLISGRNASSAALAALALAPFGWLVTAKTSIADQIKDR